MAITSYPHTSNLVEGVPDRAVAAEFLRMFYKKDRGDGILLLGDSGACQVVATSPTSRYVNVSPGYAFIQGAYAINFEDISLQIDSADSTLNRYDTVVLRLDERVNYRNIDAYVKKGTPAAYPTIPELTRNNEQYEIGLANIYVPAASSTVQQQHIRDTRLDPERCGESVPLQPIDTSKFFSEMEDAFERSWEFIRAAIDETAYGHLQNEIDGINIKIPSSASSSNKLLTKRDKYVVGDVILRFDNQSPAQLFGGTWRQITGGRYLRAASDTEQGGNATHQHGAYGSYNGSLAALIGASNSDIGRIAYVAGACQIGGQYTYSINGGASRYPGAQNHNTPVVGASSSANNNPLYQDFYVWVKEED